MSGGLHYIIVLLSAAFQAFLFVSACRRHRSARPRLFIVQAFSQTCISKKSSPAGGNGEWRVEN